MKIMLVDDEHMELSGLRNMLTQSELPTDIVAEAWNGKQAIAMALETRPDVIISDVRMPMMNGIDFVRAVRPELPDALVVMISGHEDFGAIRDALNLGVDAWLVKPLDRVELLRLLRNRFAQGAEVSGRVSAQTETQSHAARDAASMHKLFSGVAPDEAIALAQQAGLFPGQYVVLAAAPADRGALLQNVDLGALKADEYAVGPCRMPDGNVATLLSYSGVMSEAMMMNRIEQTAEQWKDALSAAYHSPMSVGVSLPGTEPQLFAAMYRQARAALDDQVIYGRNKVIFYALANEVPGLVHEVSLVELMQAGDVERFIAMLDLRVEQVGSCRDLAQARAACVQMIHELSVEAATNVQWRLFADSFGHEAIEHIIRTETLPELTTYMSHCVADWKAQLMDNRMDRNRQIVDQVAGIVAGGLAGDLSSEAIAERVYLTPAHVRRVVKNVMGITLQDYVLKMRMQRACELLGDPKLRIADVAAKLGYDSLSYFGLVFRKFYGYTPGEYRHRQRMRGGVPNFDEIP